MLKRTFVTILLSLGILLFVPASYSHAQAPQIPPNIQQIMDRIQQGQMPTAEEQKALADWGESMAKAYGQNTGMGESESGKGKEKKEELVLTVRMKAQAQSRYTYNGKETPPDIGYSDIHSEGSNQLAVEYSGEARYRVEWGTMDDKPFPFLERIDSRASLNNKGTGFQNFKQTYHPKYSGGPCTVLQEASWTREPPPAERNYFWEPDAQFKDRDTVVVNPFLGGCQSEVKGNGFTRDECSHPNNPSESHPPASRLAHRDQTCEQLIGAARDSADFTGKLQGRVDWNKPILASGTATYSMSTTDWVEYGELYSPRKEAHPKSGTITVDWSLTREAPDPSEVTVEVAGYEGWVPSGNKDDPKEPGINPMTITATVHKKGDKKALRQAYLNINLPYVSKNRGICGNWPQNGGEEEGLRFREKDFPKSGGLLYKDRTHLETDIPVEQVTFRVHSYDHGAWGTLRITRQRRGGAGCQGQDARQGDARPGHSPG